MARLFVLASLVVMCGWAAWPTSAFDAHAAARKVGIKADLETAGQAVIVLGDSIVELSTLPNSICGHQVVNAGISGLSTARALRTKLSAVIDKPAALVVVSLGVNDAAEPKSAASFQADYQALLGELKPLARHRAVVRVTLPEAGLPEARKVDAALIDAYNASIPEFSKQAGADLIAIPQMPPHHTIDGLHLNAPAYDVWTKAITGGIAAILCDTTSAQRRD